jgi:peptidoglycan hydrolase-like protein with peptidoglycan-binding domain
MRSLDDVLVACDVIITLASSNYAGVVPSASRVGVAWHYDGSHTDKGAQNWFDDPAFKLSYTRAYTDGGRRIRLAPSVMNRVYHMGACRTDARVKGANSAFYGLCITAGTGHQATAAQFEAICRDTADIARFHQARGDTGWELSNIDYWLTGHETWATPKGRKIDPTGANPRKPVLSLAAGRLRVAELLAGAAPAAPISPIADASERPLLKRGMRHEKVAYVQKLLGVQPATGFYGELTEAAVVAFQQRNGLEADGVIGDASWAKLRTLDICSTVAA